MNEPLSTAQQHRLHTDGAMANGSEAFNMTLVSESIGVLESTNRQINMQQPGISNNMNMANPSALNTELGIQNHHERQFSMSNQSFSQLHGVVPDSQPTAQFPSAFEANSAGGFDQEEMQKMQL